MENFDVQPILLKYIQEEPLSPEEKAYLQLWASQEAGREQFLKDLLNPEYIPGEVKKIQNTNGPSWNRIEALVQNDGFWKDTEEKASGAAIGSISWWRYAAAAAVLAVIATGVFFASRPHSVPDATVAAPLAAAPVIQPGGNKAILTLADGSHIDLDTSSKGLLTSQGNTKVTKLADGQLAYNTTADEKPTASAFNTLSTPRAGQFSLILPDGSKVWLNNASSLRYPVAFTGADRTVELTGEGYFEIAKDAAHPFKVQVHRNNDVSEITVLGTSFNIMAYNDESVEQATLVNGAIRFSAGTNTSTLQPGQQSVLESNGQLKTASNVDIDEITAWKQGYFHFKHSSLPSTMRQLARWYDIEVEYQGDIPPQQFEGKIERDLPLSDILRGLVNEHVHFKQEGRKLIVTP